MDAVPITCAASFTTVMRQCLGITKVTVTNPSSCEYHFINKMANGLLRMKGTTDAWISGLAGFIPFLQRVGAI